MKLAALVRSLKGEHQALKSPERSATFPWGAAALEEGVSYVLAGEHPERALGPALAWALSSGAGSLVLFTVGRRSGDLARRASYFTFPTEVFEAAASGLERALPSAIPERVTPDLAPPDVAMLSEAIASAGAEAVVRGGLLRGEVDGLEVARAELDEEGWHLEVGVGRHDRQAQRALHGGRPPMSALVSAVQEVRARRRAGVALHPANRLSRERWLRAAVVRRPEMVGCARLVGVEPEVLEGAPHETSPAAAIGQDADGADVVVVCSTGVDLDAVPSAADARAELEARGLLSPEGAKLVIAVPEGDFPPVSRSILQALERSAEARVVTRHWRDVVGSGAPGNLAR